MEATADDEHEFERIREMQLWEQEPIKTTAFAACETAPSASKTEQLRGLFPEAEKDPLAALQGEIRAAVSDFDLGSDLPFLVRLLNTKEDGTGLFAADYKKWQHAMYKLEDSKKTAEVPTKSAAAATNFIEEMAKSKTLRGKETEAVLADKDKKSGNVALSISKSKEETKKLEQWLDDVLS